jgi:hypothetical protein
MLFDNFPETEFFQIMSIKFRVPNVLLIFVLALNAFAQRNYFPPADAWETRTPEQSAFRTARNSRKRSISPSKAIESAAQSGTRALSNLRSRAFGEAVGVFKERGAMTGIIIRNGFIIAEWGEPFRVDMTFSVTKSFLPQSSAWLSTAK